MAASSDSNLPPLGTPSAPGASLGAAPAPLGGTRLPLYLGLVAGLLVLVGAAPLIGAFYLGRRHAGVTLPRLRVAGESIGGVPFASLPERVHAIVERQLGRRVYLRVGSEKVATTWRELGLGVDEAALVAELTALGHGGDPASDLVSYLAAWRRGIELPLRVALDEKKALEYLIELKDQIDRAAVDARLDLEHHTVAAERVGCLLRVYDSLVAVQYAVRTLRGGTQLPSIELAAAVTQPGLRRQDLQSVDVSQVLGSWETRYSTAAIDSDRTYNLKVGADKLNGHILRPGESFSFNTSVGDRTEKEGYRVAPVISGGELIDGLAGGMCQIASTLHAAAFFAGLDILRTTPHSRPSSYIPMGLDSTVVYPAVDLKLKNPYDFPVVIHFMVNQGSVKVELLGKELPHHVAFEREILAESKFPTTTRSDPEMPAGQKLIDQEGYPGYHIKRRRYVFDGKWKLDPKDENRPKPEVLVAKKEWDIYYPATANIVRVGTGPPNLKAKEPPPAHRIPPIPAWAKPIFYIVR